MNYPKIIETILGLIWLVIFFMCFGIVGSIELGVS